MTVASMMPQLSSHTTPHAPSCFTSTRPSCCELPPTRRTVASASEDTNIHACTIHFLVNLGSTPKSEVCFFQSCFFRGNFSIDLYKQPPQFRLMNSRVCPSLGVGNPLVTFLHRCTPHRPLRNDYFLSQIETPSSQR